MRVFLLGLAVVCLLLPAATASKTGTGDLQFVTLQDAKLDLTLTVDGSDASSIRYLADQYAGNRDGTVSAAEAETASQTMKGAVTSNGIESSTGSNLTLDGQRIKATTVQSWSVSNLEGPTTSTAPITGHAVLLLTFTPGNGPTHELGMAQRTSPKPYIQDLTLTVHAPPSLTVHSTSGFADPQVSSDATSLTLHGLTGTVTFAPAGYGTTKASPAPDLLPVLAVTLAGLVARRR